MLFSSIRDNANLLPLRRLIPCLFFALFSSLGFAQNAALVIIDMQPFFSERIGRHTSSENKAKINQILQRQRELIRLAKGRNVPILMIEYESCGATCEALVREIGSYSNTRTFVKSTDSMFDEQSGVVRDIKKYLSKRTITELIVSGANGGICVKCSIEGALNHGYKVWTDPYAIADFEEQDFVYPYHYEDGQIAVRPELIERLNQRMNINSFDEVLRPNDKRASRESMHQGCLKRMINKIVSIFK